MLRQVHRLYVATIEPEGKKYYNDKKDNGTNQEIISGGAYLQ
jgi:hypothetical protein